MSAHSREKRYNPAISTVLQSRVPIFSPVKKGGVVLDKKIMTPWGYVIIRAKQLNQIHRNLLDCMAAYNINTFQYSDGRVAIAISPYKLMKTMGVSPTNHNWIKNKLRDLRISEIELYDNRTGYKIITGIVEKYGYAELETSSRPGAWKSKPWKIIFSAEWMSLWSVDMHVKYKSLLPDVMKLKNAVSQALIRMLLTHSRKFTISLDDALVHIGAIRDGMSDRAKQKVRVKIFNDINGLNSLGVHIENGKIYYKQDPNIRFYNPSNN